MKTKTFLLSAFVISALALSGCASFHTSQQRIAIDGTKETTSVEICTLFDSHNEVGKLRTTMTDKSQGIGVGSISENSSSSNIVELIHGIGGILQALPK